MLELQVAVAMFFLKCKSRISAPSLTFLVLQTRLKADWKRIEIGPDVWKMFVFIWTWRYFACLATIVARGLFYFNALLAKWWLRKGIKSQTGLFTWHTALVNRHSTSPPSDCTCGTSPNQAQSQPWTCPAWRTYSVRTCFFKFSLTSMTMAGKSVIDWPKNVGPANFSPWSLSDPKRRWSESVQLRDARDFDVA